MELIISKGVIYYGLYTLFYYPLIVGIMRCFNLFSSTQFIKDVCMSDYINLRVLNPRYKSNFWSYFADPEFSYGFKHELPPEILVKLNEICTLENKKSTTIERHRSRLLFRVWGGKFVVSAGDFPRTITFVTIGKTQKWSVRLASAYLKLYNAHWFHTSLRLCCPKPGNPDVILRHPFLIANWLNSPQSNYGLVQTFAKNVVWPSNSFMYGNLKSNIFMPNPKRLPEFLENNFVMTLSPLARFGWVIGTYNPMINRYGYPKDTMQKRSDALIKSENFYSGIDQKNKNVTHFGRNQAIVIDQESYKKILEEFLVAVEEKPFYTPTMAFAIELLSNSCGNQKEHLAYYGLYYTIFPPTWRPPFRLENTFDLEYLTDEAKAAYYEQGPRLHRFFDRLDALEKERKVKGNQASYSEDIFNDSQIQSILSGD